MRILRDLWRSLVGSRTNWGTDIAQRGHLNVLTLNILFSEFEQLARRLADIAGFLQQKAGEGEPVDVVMLQEVVGGRLARQLADKLGSTKLESNTAALLQSLLRERGLDYNLGIGLSNGFPGVLAVFNATLTRCEIRTNWNHRLPRATDVEFRGIKVRLGRSVLLTRLRVPGLGSVNVYNTHLCSGCSPGERLVQARSLTRFVSRIESFLPGRGGVILGGDLNSNVPTKNASTAVYEAVQKVGFIDTYARHAESQGQESYCGDEDAAGCTVGVSDVPDPTSDGARSKRRIDYVFVRGFGQVLKSEVVFSLESDSRPGVSDHSAVLTRVALSG